MRRRQKPKVLVLQTDGINCDRETAYAFELTGGQPRIVHVNDLRKKRENLKDYQILAIPGGFSYGDDVAAGRILALELTSYLSDQLWEFKEKGKLILGICNGFQILIRTGLLPFGKRGEIKTTLAPNDSGHFECRWVNLKIEKSACVFLEGLEQPIAFQVAHGEGKLFAQPKILNQIEGQNLVVFRYCDISGKPTQKYPQNPNGSLNSIGGICDPSGKILGLMPHPERFVERTQYPNWRRVPNLEPQGLPIFQKMIAYVSQM